MAFLKLKRGTHVHDFLGSSIFFLLFCLTISRGRGGSYHNYEDALSKSILFFQAQRSGKLPATQRITWRDDSGLLDGQQAQVDLTGGYYDAGDNVKFNFPMAFTTTMLSWGAIEYGKALSRSDQLQNTREAIRWGTDYLLKCALATPSTLYVGVGDPNRDHSCWERPEDMNTERIVYSVSDSNPGSDVAGETAAALAAASIVFRKVDPDYSRKLLDTAKKVMEFARKHRRCYSDSIDPAVGSFYHSYSGYEDELLWGAAWLYIATKYDGYYLDMIRSLEANDDDTDIFSWDNKYAGAYVLLARQNLLNGNQAFQQYRQRAEKFMCKILPNSPSSSTKYTPGGLMFKMEGSNLQYVTSITFLVTTYAKYMDSSSDPTFDCGQFHSVTSDHLRDQAKTQVDYILGDNPMKMSYMVGYGKTYPLRIHHRGSSLPSIHVRPQSIGCDGGELYKSTTNLNQNILTGAIVGGPDQNDIFHDDRNDYAQSEPATYINAAIVGPLAYFASSY
ncbi:Endoglucanase 3 [Orobanche hederae]